MSHAKGEFLSKKNGKEEMEEAFLKNCKNSTELAENGRISQIRSTVMIHIKGVRKNTPASKSSKSVDPIITNEGGGGEFEKRGGGSICFCHALTPIEGPKKTGVGRMWGIKGRN